MDLNEILKHFNVNSNIREYGNGHINDTYLCGPTPEFILQRINSNVFKSPEQVMKNIYGVTEHIKKKIWEAGGNPGRETLNVIASRDGKLYYKTENGEYYRLYLYVENSITHECAENPRVLYYAGRAFGKFQRMLDDFPADSLYETIPDFHNTEKRVAQLKEAVKNDAANRRGSVKKEIEFAEKYSCYADLITKAMEKGKAPLRVTHNDTKLNNVLFDKDTGEDLCVIDLDTVMPGSVLYDFGDALRFGGSSCAEDETNLDKVYFDLDKFESFAKGFLEQTADRLTETEKELLPRSVLIMTYECGIRFLADYINGDVYFKIHRRDHNIERARNQFKLVMDIESKLDKMRRITERYI